MMVLASRTAELSPPVFFVWKALMRPDLHPKNQGFAWPVMFEGAALPRIVESSEFDRVVWSLAVAESSRRPGAVRSDRSNPTALDAVGPRTRPQPADG